MRTRWIIFATLIGLAPNAAPAQQAASPEPTGPAGSQFRLLSDPFVTPLPPVGQPKPAAQLPADGSGFRGTLGIAMAPAAMTAKTSSDDIQPIAASGTTLPDLENMALQCNPTLAQAADHIAAARGRWLQAGLYPNPTAGYIGAEIGNEGRAGQQGGYVGQEVVTAGKLRKSRDVAAQEVHQAEWDWQSQRQRVLTDVRRGFYDALVAQRTLELTERLLRIGEEGVRSTEALLQAQEVARADVLQAQIEAETARVLHERAKNRHAAAWRNLAAVVGVPDMPATPLVGDPSDGLPLLTWENAYNRLLAESPQLAAAQTGVARARATLDRECAQRVPNFDLMTSVQRDNATQYTWATVQAGAALPLFNRNQGNIRRAQAELSAAHGEVQRVQLELQQRLAGVFEQYATARYQVEKYSRDILPNARASLDLATKGYQQGEYNYLYLLTAQRTYFNTNLTYLDSLRDLRHAAAAIEGNLLEGSLQTSSAGSRE
jgi:outer membrane protein, heavy metal efflux system